MSPIKEYKFRYIYLLPIMILGIAGLMKIVSPGSMVNEFADFNLSHPKLFLAIIGLLEVVVCFLFLVPRTREIGFLLTTAFIGGIIAIEALKTDSLPLFPILLQTLLWAGYFIEKAPNRSDQTVIPTTN